MRALVLFVLCGCYGVEDIDAAWERADTITGELAVEVGPSPAPRAPVDVLRLGSYNIYYLSDAAEIARSIAASPELSRADVIMAQEVEHHDGEVSRAQVIGEALGMTWVYAPARRDDGFTHGVAIFSRYPIANARVMRLPLGTAAFHQNPRDALAAEIDLGTHVVTIVDLHLDVRIGPVDRIRQMHPAVTQVPDDVAIGGDLNTNPWAWVGSTVPLTATEAIVGQDQATVIDDYMSGLGFAVPIGPHESTFNRPLLDNMRLDEIYVRGHTVLGHGIATDVEGSDHWPVWVDLAL